MTRDKITLKKGAVPVHKMPVAQPAPPPMAAKPPAGEDLVQLRLDAARYRWLRDASSDWETTGVHWGQPSYWPLEHLIGEQLDVTIDKARGQ